MENQEKSFSWWQRVPVVILLVVIAWLLFIWIITDHDVEETPALIMVWVSIGLILISMFPKIIGRIKRIKLGELELELTAEIESAVNNPPLNISEKDEPLFSTKGRIETLMKILQSAVQFPKRTIQLDVNIQNNISISNLALHLYLLAFSFTQNPVVVVFRTPYRGNAIIRGIIDGRKLIKLLRNVTPEIWQSYSRIFEDNTFQELIKGDLHSPDDQMYSYWNSIVGQFGESNLSFEKFDMLIRPALSQYSIDTKLDTDIHTTLQMALNDENADWILLKRNRRVVGSLDLSEFGMKVSQSVIESQSST